MGIFKKDELILDFKGVKTEDMSSTIPYMNKLNADARVLVNQLGPNANSNRKGLVLFNDNDHFDLYKIFEKSNNLNNNDNNFSETSPFISSDVYNQLLSKLKGSHQNGGANEDRDDSSSDSESSTSSSSESDSDKKKKRNMVKKIFKKNKNDKIDLEPEEDEDFSEMSMSAGSYLSSSAHSDDNSSINSSAINSSSINSSAINSSAISTVSAKHHGRNNMSDSVNTSDINIISIDN